MKDVDDQFFPRADAIINLSNQQISEKVNVGMVSASSMYAVSRFNAWLSSRNWNTSEEMAAGKQEAIDYFVKEYRGMLEENLDDYINNFDKYLEMSKKKT